MADITPFTILIPDSKLQRLNQKLALTDFPAHEIENAGWQYGTPLSDLKRLHTHWQNTYSWRSVEKNLNTYPHFITPIPIDNFGTLNIHFLHQKSGVEGAIPLLFVHGWPGSWLEVTKMLPLLRGGEGRPAFDVVAPSLPGYGFSEGVRKKGFEIKQYAEIFNKLMLKLGYDQYVTQGGDWGFLMTRAMAHLYPQHAKATHINWIFADPPQWTSSNPEPTYNEREQKHLALAQDWWAVEGRGYLAIQGTKPATIAPAFTDSPVALLSWIYEKLIVWSDDYPWTDDEVLTWVSLYYFSTAGPDAASYTYYEALHGTEITTATVKAYIDVPLGLADFPVEIANAPKAWWGTLGPIVFSKSYEKGGHFAGWERPGDVASGLCEMFGKGGGAAGVVEGKSGYASGATNI